MRAGANARRSLPLDPTPGVNNYAALTATVVRDKQAVLLPLQANFKALAAAAAVNQSLPPELQKQLELQPLLMQGHMLEALPKYRMPSQVIILE